MIRALLLIGAGLPALAVAQPWSLSEPVVVAGQQGPAHFHHLDGAGRRHLAATSAEVAVVWEDDRTGTPQVYAAIKALGAARFERSLQVSDGSEAYEPAIVPIAPRRWLVAWEQDGAVKARVLGVDGGGPVQSLSDGDARQVTLAHDGAGRVAAVWARKRGRDQWLVAADLHIEGDSVRAAPDVAVSPVSGHAYQGYPAATWGRDGRLIVAWEDRRAGHTRLFHSWRQADGGFAPGRQLNEHTSPPPEDGEPVRMGSGVMRVMLASDAGGRVRAIWLDKRNAPSGYAVWGALSDDNGGTFGPNQIVQDELGAAVAQWHAALAGGVGGFVSAWDDAREGWGEQNEPGDVLLTWQQGDAWSPDLVVPGASGDGYQGSPALTLDPQGDLHLVWIERDDETSPTRLRYLHGGRTTH